MCCSIRHDSFAHSLILLSIHIPQVHVNLAFQKLDDHITDTEEKYTDSVLIVLGD